MDDPCERACPECEGPMVTPHGRNPVSPRDSKTRICANCHTGAVLDQMMKESK